MIDITQLKESDIGRWVIYYDGFKTERGRIKSFSNLWIFVVYKCGDDWNNYEDYTGNATKPDDLTFYEHQGDNL